MLASALRKGCGALCAPVQADLSRDWLAAMQQGKLTAFVAVRPRVLLAVIEAGTLQIQRESKQRKQRMVENWESVRLVRLGKAEMDGRELRGTAGCWMRRNEG